MKKHAKTDKMRFEILWAGSWEWVSFWNAKHGARLFDAFQLFIEKTRFWYYFGSPVDLDEVPKSVFLDYHVGKINKNEVQEWFQKKHVIWIDFGCQKGRPWEAKMLFLRGTLVKNEDLGESEISWKMHGKMLSKNHEIRSLERPRVEFSWFV